MQANDLCDVGFRPSPLPPDGTEAMTGFSAFSLVRHALTGHKHWRAQWAEAQPKAEYDVVIVGAGGHGRVVADAAILQGAWSSIAFLDQNPELPAAQLGLPIIFHFPQERNFDDATLTGLEKDRMASKLILRPLSCGQNKAVALAAVLAGPTLPDGGMAVRIDQTGCDMFSSCINY